MRGLARQLGISPAHLSDVEHDNRRPSDALLRNIVRELQHVGATLESLDQLVTGLDPEAREWAAETPGVRKLLRKVRDSGLPLEEVLPVIEKAVARKNGRKIRKAR